MSKTYELFEYDLSNRRWICFHRGAESDLVGDTLRRQGEGLAFSLTAIAIVHEVSVILYRGPGMTEEDVLRAKEAARQKFEKVPIVISYHHPLHANVPPPSPPAKPELPPLYVVGNGSLPPLQPDEACYLDAEGKLVVFKRDQEMEVQKLRKRVNEAERRAASLSDMVGDANRVYESEQFLISNLRDRISELEIQLRRAKKGAR